MFKKLAADALGISDVGVIIARRTSTRLTRMITCFMKMEKGSSF